MYAQPDGQLVCLLCENIIFDKDIYEVSTVLPSQLAPYYLQESNDEVGKNIFLLYKYLTTHYINYRTIGTNVVRIITTKLLSYTFFTYTFLLITKLVFQQGKEKLSRYLHSVFSYTLILLLPPGLLENILNLFFFPHVLVFTN